MEVGARPGGLRAPPCSCTVHGCVCVFVIGPRHGSDLGCGKPSSTVSDLWGSRDERKGEGAVREADSIWNDRRSNRDCTSSQPG